MSQTWPQLHNCMERTEVELTCSRGGSIIMTSKSLFLTISQDPCHIPVAQSSLGTGGQTVMVHQPTAERVTSCVQNLLAELHLQ